MSRNDALAGATEHAATAFLFGGGVMGAAIRANDWSSTPLGPPAGWPQSLQSAISICLHSSFPTAIYWGPELSLLYNDAWSTIPGERHPWALGRPAREVWTDIWDVVAPQISQVLVSGEGFATFDQMLPMTRGGRVHETFWNYSFTPIRGEDGRVAGIFNQGHEVTDRVLGERRAAFLLDLGDRLRALADPNAIIEAAEAALGSHLGANRVGYGDVDPSERYFTTTRNWARGVPARDGTHDLAAFGPEILAALRAGEPLLVPDVATDPRTRHPGSVAAFAAIDAAAAITASLVKHGRMRAALYVHAREPKSWTARDAELVGEVAERTWSALERARAEAAAEAQQQELQRLTDALPVLVSYMERDTASGEVRYRFVNRIYETWFDRRRDDILGKLVRDVIGAGAYAAVEAWINRALAGERVTFEQFMPYVAAGERHVHVEYVPRVGAGGAVEGIHALVQDVTEAKRAELALKESEARLRAITDNLPAGMVYQVETGRDGRTRRFVYVSQSHEKLTGIPAEAVLADPSVAYELIIPEHRQRLFEAEAAAIRDKVAFDVEVAIRRADGVIRWCRMISAAREQDDGSLIWDGIQIDITDQKDAETALRQLNDRLEERVAERTAERDRLWALSEDILGRADYGGRVLAVSPAWTKVLGWSEHELLTRPYADIIHPDDIDTVVAALEEMRRTGSPKRFEIRILTSSGVWKPVGWMLSPEPGEDTFIAVGRDLSADKARAAELENAQEALRQSQKLESMGQLTGGVAHDFNNLLTPIIGGLDMLQRRGIGDERARRTIAGALASADRAKTLVQRLLAFARRQPLQPRPIDVRAVIDGLVDLLSSTMGPRIRIVVDVLEDVPAVLADANQLEMALLNLAVNSRDAMPDGGTLTITAGEHRVDRDNRKTPLTGRFVRLSVIDTGIGMDPATIERAIEPFFSTKGLGRGTGLGLSMVHGLAAQLGGALDLKSERGVGTTVELWLPVADGPAGLSPTEARAIAPRGAGTVLLVDDEELVRLSTADMLLELGYEVTEATSAEEAVVMLERGPLPDLLVTDHLMPGMTGTELAQLVGERFPDIPLLIVSGYAEVDGIAADLPRLTKPFRQAELALSIAELMSMRPTP